MRFFWILTASCVLAVAWHAGPAAAQSGSAKPPATSPSTARPIVEEIAVEGNSRIEVETVASYLLLKVGDPFNIARMDASLKALFATGLFSDVSIRREGTRLIVRIVENPIINRVVFEGNDSVKTKQLMTEIQLRPRVVYTRTKVQNDVKRVLEIYRASGRFAATVVPKVITLPQNRVDLVFEINEGNVTGVRKIGFIGNKIFSDSTLRSVIETEEMVWWKFFSANDTYDPDRLEFDKEQLRKHYLTNGYADFRVVSAVAELTPDRNDFFITFTVEEGKRYEFGKIKITTTLRNLDVKKLRSELMASKGHWYNSKLIEQGINRLTDAAGNLGYAFVEVRPLVKRDRDKRKIDVTFDIREGPRVFVERIEIKGNDRTRDEVIRREIRLAEGDAFSTARIRRSRKRLKALGFFEQVEITNSPGSKPDRTVVVVSVEERSTGEFSLGAGFSSQEGAIGNVGLRERNFMGRGQSLALSFSLSQRTQSIDLSFTEPYFLDRNLSAGFDLFRTVRSFDDEGSFAQASNGARVRVGYEIAENLIQNWSYTLRHDTVKDVDATASIFIKEQEGSNLASVIGQALTYDKRDDRLDPTSGYVLKFQTQLSGFGGTVRFIKVNVSGGKFFSLAEDVVLSVSGEVGQVKGIGRDVRLTDRFFLGGDNLRGFATSGVGPRDAVTNDALGANRFYAGTIEITFPVGLPPEMGIRGRVFVDIGSAFSIDAFGPGVVDRSSPRISTGVGISWKSPFGPVQVDFGFPLARESFDETQVFRFNVGTRF